MSAPEDDAYVARFQQQGFVIVPDVLSAAEIERYGAAVDRAVAERTRHDDRALDEKSRYEQSFQQCLNLWEDRADVRPLSFHPAIAGWAARLLGVQAVRIWHDQALYKEPGGRVTDPHQDHPYWAIREPLTITAWIPFQDTDASNGAMAYWPGSHASGLRRFADIFSSTGLDVDSVSELAGVDSLKPGVPAGGVSFHHGLTVHAAGPNASAEPRRVHTIIFMADGCTRSEAKHPSVDRPGIEVGAAIASSLTPVVSSEMGAVPPEPPPLADPPERGWAGWAPTRESIRRDADLLKAMERD